MHFQQSSKWFEAKKNSTLDYLYIQDINVYVQLNKIPILGKIFGYIPRVDCQKIDFDILNKELKSIGCIGYQVDPLNLKSSSRFPKKYNLTEAVALNFNVVLDISQSLENILSKMKPKHRYNIKVSQKSDLNFALSQSNQDYEAFLNLYLSTAKRHGYIPRSKPYLEKVWTSLKDYAFIANVYYNNQLVVSWFVIIYQDTLYYVYGGSTDNFKEKMPAYFMVWNLILLGKEKDLNYIDFMGIKDPTRNEDGFTRFKLGWTGGTYIQYQDSFDVVLSPIYYYLFKIMMKLNKWFKKLKSR
jgi:lipid II:glycine glycyltransferase (peptidoglycan interpeptide bridge formation enzyme)